MASPEFTERLRRAGLLHGSVQAAAISSLVRQQGCHRYETLELRPDGSVRVALFRDDDETSVCRAVVTVMGQVEIDVSEVIA